MTQKSILGCLVAFLFAPCGIAAPVGSLPPETARSIASSQAQAQSQATPSGEGVLGAITATGSKRFTPAQIAEASGLKIGVQVNRETLQMAANKLAKTGLFSDVHYRFSSQGPNVSLEFQVTDASTLPVAFDNFPWFTDQELDKAIRQSVELFDGTAPEDGSYVDTIAAVIKKQLEAVGVPGRVEHRVLERPIGPGLEVQYRLVGPTLTVGAVQFTDPLAQHDERVSERLQDLVGKPFSRYYVDIFAAEQVQPIYLSQGFLKVQFGAPEARFSGDPNHPDLGHVVVIVPVTPGPRFTWGGASWSGNTVYDAAALNRMMGLSQGQTADGLAIDFVVVDWDKYRDSALAKRLHVTQRATLIVLKGDKAGFEFPPRERKARAKDAAPKAPPVKLDFTGQQPLGKCPKCGGKVFEAESAYLCERSQADKKPCRFKINKEILQRPIPREQALRLLESGKTDLLDQFISKAGKPFAAYLVMDEAGKVTFDFPPRDGGT